MTTRLPAPAPRILVAAASEEAERLLVGWLTQHVQAEVVGTTYDGDEAVRRAQELRPDLVVSNINLKGASGLEVVEQLWALAPDIGCVVVADAGSLGAQRRTMRAGALDFLIPPLGPAEADSLRVAAAQVARRRQQMARAERVSEAATPAAKLGVVVPVVSAKGGVGRSTVAATLASWLGESMKTCLCDLDVRFGDLGFWGAPDGPARTIEHLAAVVNANEATESDLQAIGVTRFGKVTLLAAPVVPPADDSFPGTHLVDTLRRFYAAVVVDTVAGSGDAAAALSATARLTIVVTTCEIGALRATRRFLADLDASGRRPRVVVANRSDRGESRETVRRTFGQDDEIVFLDSDTDFARALVVDGRAGPQQARRGISKRLRDLADRVVPPSVP